MDNLIITVTIAFVMVFICLCLLGISWLITGKSRIKPGACGKTPTQNKNNECGDITSCDLCKKPDDKER